MFCAGLKLPKNMDRWKGMEGWLRIHYFDHLRIWVTVALYDKESGWKGYFIFCVFFKQSIVCMLTIES